MSTRPCAGALALLLAVAIPALGDDPPKPELNLPLSRVVLFTSGVGYYERQGSVDGNARVRFQVPADDVNDLLKSLVVEDTGGTIQTVGYDNRDPVERTLRTFAIDLNQNPSLGQLLNQVRGERVEVETMMADATGKSITSTLRGVIVGVEDRINLSPKQVNADLKRLNLLTDDGLRGIGLDQIERLKFLEPALDRDFRSALNVLATARDRHKKSVTLDFAGKGKRAVRLGYVAESPIWKTSYRLSLDADKNTKAHLQGWAMVENTTDEDWSKVRLGLVSGRPISFQMDLYEPLYFERPTVTAELFASLRPRLHEGAMEEGGKGAKKKTKGDPADGAIDELDDMLPVERKQALKPGTRLHPLAGVNLNQGGMGLSGFGGGFGGALGLGGVPGGLGGIQANPATRDLDFRKSVANAALAGELGSHFQYRIEQPVSLGRQKSALIPIVNLPIAVSKVSIFNPDVHPKYPMLGVRVENTTDLHLMQGPLTMFEAGSYAGDARMGNVAPREKCLLSYAVDLGCEVEYRAPRMREERIGVKVIRGVFEFTHRQLMTTNYTIKNRSAHERSIVVEHLQHPSWKLTSPEHPAERTQDLYRFELKVPAGETKELIVVEEEPRKEEKGILESNQNDILVLVKGSIASPKVKEALASALNQRTKLAELKSMIDEEGKALEDIGSDQARMRANMERVPTVSEAYKRYLKKFDEQETDIEKRRQKVTRLEDALEGQRKAYEKFIRELTVD